MLHAPRSGIVSRCWLTQGDESCQPRNSYQTGGLPRRKIPSSTKERQIENAASVAGMILTTESLITDVPDPTPAGAPAMPPMGY